MMQRYSACILVEAHEENTREGWANTNVSSLTKDKYFVYKTSPVHSGIPDGIYTASFIEQKKTAAPVCETTNTSASFVSTVEIRSRSQSPKVPAKNCEEEIYISGNLSSPNRGDTKMGNVEASPECLDPPTDFRDNASAYVLPEGLTTATMTRFYSRGVQCDTKEYSPRFKSAFRPVRKQNATAHPVLVFKNTETQTLVPFANHSTQTPHGMLGLVSSNNDQERARSRSSIPFNEISRSGETWFGSDLLFNRCSNKNKDHDHTTRRISQRRHLNRSGRAASFRQLPYMRPKKHKDLKATAKGQGMFDNFSQPPETKIAWENFQSDGKCMDSRRLGSNISAFPSKTVNEQLTRPLYKLHVSTKNAVSNKSSLEATAASRRTINSGNQNVSSALSSITSLPCGSSTSSLWGKQELDDTYHEQGDFPNSITQEDLVQRTTDDHQFDANKNNRKSGTLELLAKASAQLNELRLSVSGHQPSVTEANQPSVVGVQVIEPWEVKGIASLSPNGFQRYARVPPERNPETKDTVNDQPIQERTPEPPQRAARGRFCLPLCRTPRPLQRSGIKTGRQTVSSMSSNMQNEEANLSSTNRPNIGHRPESRGQSVPRTFQSQTFLHFSTRRGRPNEEEAARPRSLSENSRPVAFRPVVVARKRQERPQKPTRNSVNIFETPLSRNHRKHTVLACLHAETPDASQSVLPTKPKFRRRFFLPEMAQIEEMLFDSHDRRVKAICSRYLCDLKVYSKMLHGGCLRNVIVLSACHMESLRKCVRALDSRMNWCLTAQLK